MAISVLNEEKIFKLDAGSSSYVMAVMGGGRLIHLYYGARISDSRVKFLAQERGVASFWAIPAGEAEEFSTDVMPMEYSGAGTADLRPAAIASADEEGDNVTDLLFDSYQVIEGKPDYPGLPHTYLNDGDGAQTLKITLCDKVKDLCVDLYYTVFDFSDAIARWTVIRNEGKQAVKLTRAMSASLQFPDKDFDLIHLHGAWAREFNVERTPVMHTTQSVQSFRGSSSHLHNPFAVLARKDAGEDSGEVYGLSLIYSSNFLIETDVDAFDTLRVNAGINDRAFAWTLQSGESFATPECVLVYSDKGLGEMSRTYHKLYRRNLARGKYRDKARPVLLNSWEGVYMDFTGEKLKSMARSAAKLGIELFVLDDGWFGARNDDTCALGDWVVNEKKLGCTMKQLVDDIRAEGIEFGLWFEPEMISPDSDLYRAHPDWCLHQKKRAPSLGRHQLILDMTRKDVRDYVVDIVSSVLSSADIRYVKWDMNRNMAEVGSAQLPAERIGEIYHRYILGVYEVMERITSAFPDVLFESCSGGGGRFDCGMLYYMPQTWTSDNSDAIERLPIQHGTSLVYPLSSMSAHVSASPNHQTGHVTPFDTRFNVAFTGSFGYELDPTALSEEEQSLVRRTAEFYKKYSHVAANGRYFRLRSCYEGDCAAWEYISDDDSICIAEYILTHVRIYPHYERLKLKGLDPDARYRDDSGNQYTGSELMGYGIPVDLTYEYSSKMWVLEKIK